MLLCVSGCIGQGPSITGGPGIIITDFSVDYSTIYAEESVGLNLEVENQGEYDAYIHEVTWFGVRTSDWGLSNPKDKNPHYVPGIEPEVGFEGGAWFDSRLITAPSTIKTTTSFDLGVRVEYLYTTDFTGTIRIVSPNYLRTLSKEDKDALIRSGGIRESSSTAGPMSVKAASGPHFTARAPGRTIAIPFRVTNIGPGLPYRSDVDSAEAAVSDGLYQIHVSSYSGIKCDNDVDNPITLSRGKNGGFTCDLDIPKTVTNYEDRAFSFTLIYRYYVDGSTTLTVNPAY